MRVVDIRCIIAALAVTLFLIIEKCKIERAAYIKWRYCVSDEFFEERLSYRPAPFYF